MARWFYSSRSPTAENLKWRVIVPLANPISGSDYEIFAEILNDKLEASGIKPDRRAQLAGQICYLPNRGDYYEKGATDILPMLDVDTAWSSERAAKLARQAAQEADRQEGRQESIEKMKRMVEGGTHNVNHFE